VLIRRTVQNDVANALYFIWVVDPFHALIIKACQQIIDMHCNLIYLVSA